ncbi:interleukin-17 receptor C [Megalops cyprinoides]|uniref:interleukin-17 receptor C n=1 Tax=Megalops cyprinoides TaxID=118141 RepID=UPI00186507EF|nr:interleukin-17 receptor C [Megalops cyprinoides]
MLHNSKGLMAHLVQIGWVLLSLRVCASAVVLRMIEYGQGPQLTCHEGLTDCSVEDEDPMRPGSGADVNRLELKPLLCCRKGKDCRPCLEIHIHFTITAFHDDQDQSGEGEIYESTDREEGGGSSQDILLYQTASINVCYNVPNFLNICKRLEFTLPSVAPEDRKPEMWLSLVVSDKLLFGSPVFVTTKSTHRNLTLPSEKDVCSPALKRIVRECDVPTLHTVINREKGVAILEMDKDDMNYSLSMGMCMKYGEKRDCIFQKLNSTHKFTIPLHFVTPCLCFQVWWLKRNAVRVNTCPFLNHTEFLKNMWDNVSLSVVPTQTNGNDTALSWELTAPCRVEAELWLCRMGEGRAGQKCGEVEGSRQNNIKVDWKENFQGHRMTGEFNNIKPHPSLCVLGKVQGMARELGPWCPYADVAPRERWSLAVLVSVLVICLAILGAYLLHGSLKSWVWKCFKDEDIRGAVGGGQVVLLYPPDSDQTLPGLVCRLGSSLSALGFNVSLDLWSRGELSVLGPVPWLHSRLDRLQRHGGKVVLILTRAALERAEEWGRWGRDRDAPLEKGEGCEKHRASSAPYCSPYSDVFSASLSCVLADYLQGRAGERFVLAQFESLPPLPPGNGQALPELFRGLPLYSLPSQSLGFLTELAVARGGHSHRRRAGGLRAASRALTVGLRGFGGSGGFWLPGFSQGGAGSGTEDAWETVPLQPCHTPPPTSPNSSPKSGKMDWV